MKVMQIISFVICGLGLFGGLTYLIDGDVAGGVMSLAVYGFFLALTANIKN
jgi:hypothetical protein